MPSVVLDAASFYAKLDKIAKAWSHVRSLPRSSPLQTASAPDAMAIVMSKVSEDPQRINTVDFL